MIKTVKLAYLADRRFLELYNRPLLNDDLYCLDHGPIDSVTLNFIKGDIRDSSKHSTWAEYVGSVDPDTYQFSVAKNDIYFGELSEAEEGVLVDLVKRFKDMKPFELVDCDSPKLPRMGQSARHLYTSFVRRRVQGSRQRSSQQAPEVC